jgi:hypothetical protein
MKNVRVFYTKECLSETFQINEGQERSTDVRVKSTVSKALFPLAQLWQVLVETMTILNRMGNPAYSLTGTSADSKTNVQDFFNMNVAGEPIPFSAIKVFEQQLVETEREKTVTLHEGFKHSMLEHEANKLMGVLTGKARRQSSGFAKDYNFLEEEIEKNKPFPQTNPYLENSPYYAGRATQIGYAPNPGLNIPNIELVKLFQNQVVSFFGMTMSGLNGERQGNSTVNTTFQVLRERAALKEEEVVQNVQQVFTVITFDVAKPKLENVILKMAFSHIKEIAYQAMQELDIQKENEELFDQIVSSSEEANDKLNKPNEKKGVQVKGPVKKISKLQKERQQKKKDVDQNRLKKFEKITRAMWQERLVLLFYNTLRIKIEFISAKQVEPDVVFDCYERGWIAEATVAKILSMVLGFPVGDYLLPAVAKKRKLYDKREVTNNTMENSNNSNSGSDSTDTNPKKKKKQKVVADDSDDDDSDNVKEDGEDNAPKKATKGESEDKKTSKKSGDKKKKQSAKQQTAKKTEKGKGKPIPKNNKKTEKKAKTQAKGKKKDKKDDNDSDSDSDSDSDDSDSDSSSSSDSSDSESSSSEDEESDEGKNKKKGKGKGEESKKRQLRKEKEKKKKKKGGEKKEPKEERRKKHKALKDGKNDDATKKNKRVKNMKAIEEAENNDYTLPSILDNMVYIHKMKNKV